MSPKEQPSSMGKWSVRLDRSVGRTVYKLHRWLYKRTGGRIGGKTPMGPIILLGYTGRKSGRRYETLLLSMRDDDGFVVVASNGGRPDHPQWYRNVVANSDVEVQFKRDRRPMHATVVEGERRSALWERLTDQYDGWAHYQTLTDRVLPVIELRPR